MYCVSTNRQYTCAPKSNGPEKEMQQLTHIYIILSKVTTMGGSIYPLGIMCYFAMLDNRGMCQIHKMKCNNQCYWHTYTYDAYAAFFGSNTYSLREQNNILFFNTLNFAIEHTFIQVEKMIVHTILVMHVLVPGWSIVSLGRRVPGHPRIFSKWILSQEYFIIVPF